MDNHELELFLIALILSAETAADNAKDELISKVNRLLNRFDTKASGNIYAPSRSIPQKNAIIRDINLAVAEYVDALDTAVNTKDIDSAVQDDIGESYTEASLIILLAFIKGRDEINKAIAGQLSAQLNDVMTKGALSGIKLDVLIGQSVDIIEKHGGIAKREAGDSLIEYYSVAIDSILPKKEDDKFLYFGSLIPTSRRWCIDHLNGIYTRKQIKAFDSQNWVGKMPGSTLINRGGYNCRHIWRKLKA